MQERESPPSSPCAPRDAERGRGSRTVWLDVAGVAAASMAVLLVASTSVDLSRLHYGCSDSGEHLNDQVGYMTSARNLVGTGTLSSNVIFPSVLHQNATKSCLYVPGYYYVLAASYGVFGFSILSSLLPSLLAFVATAVFTFLAGRARYGRAVGGAAAALVILFPPNIIYAFTAMAESTFVCVCTMVICAFLCAPRRYRPVLGPLLIGAAFLVRETALLLAVPFSLLLALDDSGKPRLRAATVCGAASVVVCVAIAASPLVAGRPSLLLANLFNPSFQAIYTDAIAQHAIAPKLLDWPPAIVAMAARNLRLLVQGALALRFDVVMLSVVVVAPLVACALRTRRRDALVVGAAALSGTVFLAMLALYTPVRYRGIRTLLFVWPVAATALAAALIEGRRVHRLAGFTALPVAAACLWLVTVMFERYTFFDRVERSGARVLEQLGHDDRRVLVAPHEGVMEYLLTHYPVKWSFTPANAETLDLLAQKYDVGTVVLEERDVALAFRPGTMEARGFEFVNGFELDGQRRFVFTCRRARCSSP